jgi:hypothetical protein
LYQGTTLVVPIGTSFALRRQSLRLQRLPPNSYLVLLRHG